MFRTQEQLPETQFRPKLHPSLVIEQNGQYMLLATPFWHRIRKICQVLVLGLVLGRFSPQEGFPGEQE